MIVNMWFNSFLLSISWRRKEKESSLKAGVSGGFSMLLDEKLRKSTECLKTSAEKGSSSASAPAATHSSKVQPLLEQASPSEADVPSSTINGQLKEDLASSIDNTLAKVLSGIKTLDQIQQNPGNVIANVTEKPEAAERSINSGTTVPILVKPPSPTGDMADSSAFPNFSRSKNKAATLPKESAYVDESMKTFGGRDSGSVKKVDLRTRSLTYAEGNAVSAIISEQDVGSSSSVASKSESVALKDVDATSPSQTATRSAPPRSGQMPIPAVIPTVPSAGVQPPTPTGSNAPVVPPKPNIVKKPAVIVGGTSPQLARLGDANKTSTLPKK